MLSIRIRENNKKKDKETDLLHRVRGSLTRAFSKILSLPLLAVTRSLTAPPQAGSLKKFQAHWGASDLAGLKNEGIAGA